MGKIQKVQKIKKNLEYTKEYKISSFFFEQEEFDNIKVAFKGALQEGFKIVMPTGYKENYVYFLCNRLTNTFFN